MDSRWGLGRGLLSGLLNTTSGVLEVPAGGWPLVEILALFALWASVSTSLRDEDDSEWAAPFEEMEKAKKKRREKKSLLFLLLLLCCFPLPLRAEGSKVKIDPRAYVCR